MLLKQCISIIVSISLLSNQMLLAGSLDLDKSASQKTSIETAPNGVPIVNITTPNAQGLSHNKFTNYNVEQKGLILNNSANVAQTQLAGFIAPNTNLSGSAAKTILNEVTGTNRSLLNGYTEVAGSSADVIIANPNGISINGGGFINTPKVTLSTGKPELLNGQVGGFNVNGGDILIEGDGFNAAANSQVDLYSKVLTLNAKLHAQSLNIVTGENHIASDGTITSKQASGTGVSLDSSALGGIYAQKITLVGTDKGVGVNLPPEVLASNGAINISSDGKITFQKATASESITASSASSDIEVNGAVSASNDIALHAKEAIINNDTITAGLQADGSANTASTLALQASSITNTKNLYANGAMSLDASSVVENKDTINALETIQIKTDSLKNSGTMLSDKILNIEAQTSIANDGTLSSNKDVTITAQSVDNKGFITAANSLLLTAASLSNTGTIHSNNHLKLTLNGDFSNEGMINSGADATLLVNGAFINNNILSAGLLSDGSTNTASTLTIQSLTLTNTAKISSLGDVYLNTSTLTNNSYINASNILYILADTLNNSGTMYSNAYLILRLTQALNNEGTLNGGKSVDIISNGSVSNNNIISSGLLSDGTTNDTATLNLQASDITNTAKINSRGSLNVVASALTNRGYLSAYNALQVNATTLNNYGVLFSGTDMNLWVSDLLYNYENANILALGNLVMAKDATLAKTKRIVNDKATIETIEGDISLYAENFENKTDGLVKGTKTINSQTITAGALISVDESIIAQAQQALINEGKATQHSSISAKKVCVYRYGNNLCHRATRYNGISESLVMIVSSNEMYSFNEDDLGSKINSLLLSYNLSVRFGEPTYNRDFGWYYIIPDLKSEERQRQVTITSEQEYVLSKNTPAKLLSGKKLSINADTVTNYLSEISANDDLTITGNTLNNGSEVLFQVDARTGQYEYCYRHCSSWNHSPDYTWAPLPATTTYTQTDAAYSLIYSAKNITGNLATVNNIDIKSNQAPLGHSATTAVTSQTDSVSVAPVTPVTIDPKTDEKKITLPKDTNGLFVVSTNPKSKYLVETNPAFASFSNFISSDYMLSRLGYNPDATTKRLGDAFYENRLVRDSVFEQTGKRYLDPSITNDSEQFQYLMNNALSIKDDLKLTPNVRLSNEQIASLTKDIVWMEEREVEGQQVLVPVVYIANVTIERTADNGARIVAKEDINLNVENLTNQGDITADGDVTITASKNIYNEGGAISSAENMTLQANDGVYNISSELTAKALSINATTFQSDIASQDITRTYANSGAQNSQLLSEASTINVQDDVTIKTAKNLSIIGTNLDAGGDVTLTSTDGDIAISSKTHTDTYDFKTRRGYNKGTSTQEISSSINADSISMNANNLLINASDVTAQNDMNIKADNIAITSGENRVYTDSKYKIKGGFMGGSKQTADTVDKKEVVSSTLSAKNLNIDAKSLSIQGSKLTAEQATIASEIIELISLKNSDYESHFSKTSGMMTQTIASKGHIKEEVVSALIQVQNQLIINNKDVTSQLQTDNILKTITSQSGLSVEQIKLVEAYAQSEEWNKKTTSLTGMGTLIIAAVVTVCTMGAGGFIVGLEAANTTAMAASAAAAEAATMAATTGTAAAAATAATTAASAAAASSALTTATIQAAVVQSIVTQVANALVTAAITGNNPNIDMASLVKGAVLAGVTSYTSMTGYTNVGDLGYGSVVNKIAQSGVNAGIKTAITGSNLKDNLINEMAQNVYTYVGDVSLAAGWNEGSLNKVILHGVVGAGVAAAKGEDVLAGAASGAMAELARPLTNGQNGTIQSTVSSVIGGITAGAVGGDASVNVGSYIGQTSDQFNRQLHEKEVNFIENNAQSFADAQGIPLEDAKARLAQQGLRQVDKAWSYALGTETDTAAQAFLAQNAPTLFTVKNAYEFKDGTTNGEQEIGSLSKEAYNQLKNFYTNNVYVTTSTNNDGSMRPIKEAFKQDKEAMLSSINGETINQTIRDFIPNAIETLADTPKTFNSASNYLENITPTTTQERMNELYNQGNDGSKVQANLATMDAIDAATMVTGVATIGKNVASSVVTGTEKAVEKSVGETALKRVSNGVELDPRLPDPVAGLEYKPTILDNANPNIANSHLNGYTAELKLANEIVALPDQAVVKYGDAIGRNGADVISVDVKTGEVTLWDSKYRSSDTIIKESPTFKMDDTPLAGALKEAKEAIKSSTLPDDIQMKALQNLEKNTYTTNTVGAGNVKNSVTTKICNGKICGE